jgi:hypothetical protein
MKLLKMKLFRQFGGLSALISMLVVCSWPSLALVQTPATGQQSQVSSNAQGVAQVPKPSESQKATDVGRKTKKIYTDEDFKAAGFHGSYEGTEVDIGDINLCDQRCFNQLMSGTSFNTREYEQRKELTLQAIENTAKDADWQATLHGYARYRVKACALMEERQTILSAHTDPRNVTREQIQVEKEYDEREAALRQEAISFLHQRRLDWKYATGAGPLRVLETKFAYYQISRVNNAPCPVKQPSQPAYEPRNSSENDDDP